MALLVGVVLALSSRTEDAGLVEAIGSSGRVAPHTHK